MVMFETFVSPEAVSAFAAPLTIVISLELAKPDVSMVEIRVFRLPDVLNKPV